MWVFGHIFPVIGLCLSCSGTPDPGPGIETMSSILEEMIRHNQTPLPADSLALTRKALFEKYGTNEREIRAWIAATREDVTRSQKLAKRVAETIGKDSGTQTPSYGKKRPPGQSR